MKRRFHPLHYFNNMKIGKKIMLAFVLASIVPILAIQFIGYHMNANSLKRKIDTLMVDNLTQLSERADLTMDIYSNLVYQIYVDDKIIENVNILLDEDGEGREVAFHSIYNRLQQAEKSVKGIRCISVICTNGQSVTYDAMTGSSIENLWDDYTDLRDIAPYRDVQGQPGMLITPTTRHRGYDSDAYYFHISKCMYDYDRLDKGTIATIVMSVDESVLREICAVALDEDEAEYNINFITDETGFVISYPDPFYTGINMNPNLTVQEFVRVTGLLKGQNTAVNKYVNEHRGWVYYNVYNKDYMMRDIKNNQIMFILISLTAILFSSLLICYIVRRIGSSVALITDGIDQVKDGNLNVSVKLESMDELGQIASNFNDMTGKVRDLVDEVSEAKDKQKNAEIRALTMLQELVEKGYMPKDCINWSQVDVARQFAAGKCAMMENGPWALPLVEEAEVDYGVVTLPVDQRSIVVTGGENFGVIRGKNVDGALALISYYYEDDVMLELNEQMYSLPPIRRLAVRLQEKNPVYRVFVQQMDHCITRSAYPYWPQITGVLSESLYGVITGEMTPQEAAGVIRGRVGAYVEQFW